MRGCERAGSICSRASATRFTRSRTSAGSKASGLDSRVAVVWDAIAIAITVAFVDHAVGVAVALERRRAQAVPPAPFLFAIGMNPLQLGSPVDLVIVAMLPLPASAGKDETADK